MSLNSLKKNIVLIIAYLIVGKLSLILPSSLILISPLWFISGIALATTILWGYQVLPAIFLSSLFVSYSTILDSNIQQLNMIEVTLSIALIATLQAAIGAFLVRKTITLPTSLEQGQEYISILIFGGILPCIIGAACSTSILLINELIIQDNYLLTCVKWSVSNIIGIVLFTPILLIRYSKESSNIRKFSTTISLSIISIFAVGVFYYVLTLHNKDTYNSFKEFTATKTEFIKDHIIRTREVLKSIEQFYNSSTYVDRDEFRIFASYALETYSEIKALEWIPRVSFNDKHKFEELAKSDGFKDFKIFEKEDESIIPVLKRSEYFPVFYLEPFEANKKAFGFDLASNIDRLIALESSGDSGKQFATSRIKLLQGSGEKAGFLIFNPVYDINKPKSTVEERREALKGFIIGVFNVNDLVNVAFQGVEAEYADIHIYESNIGTDDITLYGSKNHSGLFSYKEKIEIAGRNWVVDYTPTSIFIAENSSNSNVMIELIVGVFFCSFFVLYLLTTTARTEIIKRTVKQKTLALHESEGKMRSIMENVVEGLITITHDGKIESYNHSCEHMFGYKLDEVIGKNIKILMPIEYSVDHDMHMSNYNHGGKAVILGVGREVQGQHKDGTIFPMDLSVNQIILSDGRKIFSGVMRDVTERKNAEEKLQEYASDLEFQKFALEEAKLKAEGMAALTNHNPNPLIKISINGKILLVNKVMGKILGSVDNPDANHPLLKGIVEKSISDKIVVEEIEYNDIIYLQTIVRTRVAGNEEILVYYSDVTPIKKAQEKAEESTRLKSDFLATMSHEIRTPMNGIFGMAELVLETDLTSKQRSHINTLMSSADSLLILIDDILDFSKIEAGKLELEPIPFNLRALNENIIELLSIKAMNKSIEVMSRYVPGTPEYLIGDSGRVRQIINNLVGNAIKFTNSGYVLVTIEQWKKKKLTKGKVGIKISVTDSGIGIPDDMQGVIFDKFSQADTSTTRKFGGTGLGLAICKQLSNMMGGIVGIESTVGKGSTFWFTMILEEGNEFHNEDSKEEIGLASLNGKKVLILDSLDVNCRIIEEELSDKGMECRSYLKPSDALSAIYKANDEGKPFHIVLTDYYMKEMNGLDFAKKVKSDNTIPDIMFIMISSTSKSEKDSKKLYESGFSTCIPKPIRGSKLTYIISKTWDLFKNNKDKNVVYNDEMDNSLIEVQKVKFDDVRILLAEDNHVNQDFALQILSNLGCDVDLAENGYIAVELATDNKYDIILMDCQMPVMDGYEASEYIGNIQNMGNMDITPIVALTANAMKGDREKCISHGMHDYLAKPVRKATLVEVLTKWLPEKISIPEVQLKTETETEEKIFFNEVEVLLVEDNFTNRIVASEILKSFGCKVTEVENGKKAIEIISDKFDIVIMDCQMPVMDGYEASIIINKMRNNNEIPNIPIIALTGNYSKEDRQKCLSSGMNDYITKPVKKGTLRNILEKWIEDDKKEEKNNNIIELIDNEILEGARNIMKDKFSLMIEHYIEDTNNFLIDITDALDVGDIKTIILSAHSIKSSSQQTGAIKVSSIAADIEDLAKEGSVEKEVLQKMFGQLEEAYNKVLPEYNNIIRNDL